MTASHHPLTHRVQFLLVDEMLATSASLPAEMLSAAQSVADSRQRGQHSLSIDTVATSIRRVKTRAGLPIIPEYTLSTAPAGDIIFVPSLWRNPQRIIRNNPGVTHWLQQAAERGATIAGVGTGCCFLAEAGLLDGKPATTHWYYFDEFAQHYPKVKLKRDYFITQAGEIYCAASVNSLADLTVHFIQKLYSLPIAHHVERHFSHEIRRSYESLRYFEGNIDKHSDETVLQAQLWMQDHFSEEVKVSLLAELFDMSTRTFNRRFKAATGKTPLDYLQELRLNTAKELLQTSNLNIGEIAFKVGYTDVSYFSRLFKTHYQTSPHEYRKTVRAKLFSVSTE